MQLEVQEILASLQESLNVEDGVDPVEALAEEARETAEGNGVRSWRLRAFRLGVEEIRYANLGSIDGRLRLSEQGKYQIEVNSKSPATRQLFSLAHEIGHILLERHVPPLGSDLKHRSLFHSDYSIAEETVVDRLAAAMLLPSDVVMKMLRQSGSVLQTTADLQTRFGVSFAAILRRLSDLGARVPPILRFRCDRMRGELKLIAGPRWKLPLALSPPPGWTIPLSQISADSTRRDLQLGVVRVCHECGLEEDLQGEFLWQNSTRVMASF